MAKKGGAHQDGARDAPRTGMIEIPLEALCSLVRRAGDIAKAMQKEATFRYKQDGSPVSRADLASHAVLEPALKAFGYPVCSEEAECAHRTHDGPVWLVDPLDGTKDFVAGQPEWSVMVGLVSDGLPHLGVVYAPCLGTLWSARASEGAFCEKGGVRARVRVSGRAETRGAIALTSRSHRSVEGERHLEQLGFSIRRMGSSGVKVGLVASGEADMYWSDGPLHEWDVCAADIVLREAGGRLTDMYGRSVIYSGNNTSITGCIASNVALRDAVLS